MLRLAIDVAPWAALYCALTAASMLFGPVVAAHHRNMKRAADRMYWASSVNSTVNGVVCTVLAAVECSRSGLMGSGDFLLTTAGSHRVCNSLLGYLVWDSVLLLWNRGEWRQSSIYLMHHALAIFGWSCCVQGSICHNVAVPIVMCEATSPFINARYFL